MKRVGANAENLASSAFAICSRVAGQRAGKCECEWRKGSRMNEAIETYHLYEFEVGGNRVQQMTETGQRVGEVGRGAGVGIEEDELQCLGRTVFSLFVGGGGGGGGHQYVGRGGRQLRQAVILFRLRVLRVRRQQLDFGCRIQGGCDRGLA